MKCSASLRLCLTHSNFFPPFSHNLQVLATEQLGTETAIKLKQQTDQLVNIHKNVDLIESDLQRADKIVRHPHAPLS